MMFKKLPKQIEDHIFRIAQEIISNTTPVTPNANHLDVYLYQIRNELHLENGQMGLGFEQPCLMN